MIDTASNEPGWTRTGAPTSCDDAVSVIDGLILQQQVELPNLNSSYGPDPHDIGVAADSGLVYVLDNFSSAIHVISNTQLVTTLIGYVEQPRRIIADKTSGEMYVFYTSQKGDKPHPHAAILSGTQIITDITLPAFGHLTAAFNPVDERIYVAGHVEIGRYSRVNTLL